MFQSLQWKQEQLYASDISERENRGKILLHAQFVWFTCEYFASGDGDGHK